MAGTVTRGMPTPEIVKGMLPGSGATGTFYGGLQVVRVPIGATVGAGTAAAAWINAEYGTVIAQVVIVVGTIGNTGTYVVGRVADGTGTGNDIISSHTMTVGIIYRVTTGTALAGTAGETGGLWTLVNPGGAGNPSSTNNSITVGHTDGSTGTSVASMIVTYMRVA